MLSNVDIRRELGKGIVISPFKKDAVRGASLNLSVSRYAVSLRTNEPLEIVASPGEGPDERALVIPPRDTALIWTEESLSLDHRIAALCHSMLRRTTYGLSHLGTTVNPQWTGGLVVPVSNHSVKPIELVIHSPFATLSFHYLRSRSDVDSTNDSGRLSALPPWLHAPPGIQDWAGDHNRTDRKLLKLAMVGSEEFKQYLRTTRAARGRALAVEYGLVPFAVIALGGAAYGLDHAPWWQPLGVFHWYEIYGPSAIIAYFIYLAGKWSQRQR